MRSTAPVVPELEEGFDEFSADSSRRPSFRMPSADEPRLDRAKTLSHRVKTNIVTSLATFIESTAVESFIICLVFGYAILVFMQLTLQEEIEATPAFGLVIIVIDMVVLCIFLIEILIKIIVFGKVYIYDVYNMFDASLVVVSIAMGIIDLVVEEEVLSSVLALRGILRIMRLLVVFRRVCESQSAIKFIQLSTLGYDISSPVELVLCTLTKLASNGLISRQNRVEVEVAISVIKKGELYKPVEGLNECLDNAARAWLTNATSGIRDVGNTMPGSDNTTFLSARAKLKLSVAVEKHLSDIFNWHINIWGLNEDSGNNAMYIILTRVCYLSNLFEEFIDGKRWDNFALSIQSNYHPKNLYHNACHAADVTHSSFWFLTTGGLKTRASLEQIDALCLLVAAGIHDVDHRGFNNGFMIKAMHQLSIRYNDKSVMENHHVAVGFAIIQSPDSGIFNHLSRSKYDEIRARIIALVLATDIATHFQHLGKLNTRCGQDGFMADPTKPEDAQLVLGCVLHAADISNPAKPLRSYMTWTGRVLDEYFAQGDVEKSQALLPVSMFCDRKTTNIAKCQVGFIDVLAHPLYATIGQILPVCESVCLPYLRANKAFWESKTDLMQEHMGDIPIWLPPIPDDYNDPRPTPLPVH